MASHEAQRIAGGLGVRDATCDLRGERGQECDFVFVVTSDMAILNHEHANDLPDVHDRYAEERTESILRQSVDQDEPRVGGRVVQIDRFSPFGHQADETLAGGQRNLADRFAIPTLVGRQVEPPGYPVAQVDGGDFGIENHGHSSHQEVQRGPEAWRGTHVLDDLPKRVEHG